MFDIKKGHISVGIIVFTILVLIFGSIYTVKEGHVGIVKRWGKAIAQTNPGMNFKLPFADSVTEVDVRTRRYVLKLSASTTGTNPVSGAKELQMPSQVVISANWNIPKESALEIYVTYGGMTQYESRILNPKVTRSVKQVFPHYDIESIISDRESVRNEIATALADALSGNMVKLTAINIENVIFNTKIASAVTKKQVAKLALQEQRDILAKQDLKAQETTNVAKAEALGIKAKSIEKAAAIAREGLAEAQAIEAKAAALGNNPLIIKLTEAQNWDGKLPSTIMGSSAMPIMDMRKK